MRFLKPAAWLKALRIILAPAWVPLTQLAAAMIFGISLIVVVFGFFAGAPRDHNRIRYLLATAEVRALSNAVERYRADCGEYPSAKEGLRDLVLDRGVKGWHGPYIEEVPLDVWHRPYIYRVVPDSAPEILSYGADGTPGGKFFDADLSSRNLRWGMPSSPYEVRAGRVFLGIWIGAWLSAIGSVVVLRTLHRRRPTAL